MHNRIQLIWVPGHSITEYEISDALPRAAVFNKTRATSSLLWDKQNHRSEELGLKDVSRHERQSPYWEGYN